MTDKVPADDSSIDSAASALSAGLGAWLPIATAPKDGTVILGYWCDEYGGDYGITCYETPNPQDAGAEDSEGWVDALTCEEWLPPKYWMPLPKAPNVK